MAISIDDRYSLLTRAVKSQSGQLSADAKKNVAFNPARITSYGAKPFASANYRYYDTLRKNASSDPRLRANLGIPGRALESTDTFMNWGTTGAFGEPATGPATGGKPGTGGMSTGGPSGGMIPGDEIPETPTENQPPPDYSTSQYAQKAQDYGSYMEMLTQLKPLFDIVRRYYNLGWVSGGQVHAGVVPSQNLEAVLDTNEKYESLVDQIETGLGKYGFSTYPYFYQDANGANRAEFYVRMPGPDGQMKNYSIDEALTQLGGEKTRLEEEDLRSQDYDEITGRLFDLWDEWEGQNPGVDPFADPNKWTENIQSIFGDLGAMPDTTAFFETIFDLLPISNYTEAAMPGLDTPERFARWIDDLKATGFTVDMVTPGKDQEFRDWLYDQAQSLNPQKFFDFDRSIYDKMTTQEVSELMKLINYGENGVLSSSEMRRLAAEKMAPIKNRAQKDLRLKLSRYAEAGRGYSGIVNRTVQDMMNDLYAEEMGTTADLIMSSLKLAEEGKLQGIEQLAKLRSDELDAALQIMGLKGQLGGDYLTFLSQIGQVSTSEYATKTQAYMAMQELQLKADLGIAGLDLEMYKTDTGLDVEKLKVYAENYWQQQGFNFEVKKQAFEDAIMRYNTAAEISTMLQAGQTERLLQMADLAIKGQAGDREAWGMYQKMRYENYGLERGMDIQQAGAIADLMYQKYELGTTIDAQKWIEQNRAFLQVELTKMNIRGQEDLARLEAEYNKPGFWQTLGQLGISAASIMSIL